MMTLLTGLPGNGKTLYTLFMVKAYAEKENREVYYSGIKDLKLPWTEFDPETWPSLPAGSIIVIDEAQFVFSKKPNGSKLPEHYEKLAVHRHSGYDIFLITQDPALVDTFVRKLCGRHLHLIRKFGMQRANIWEWAVVNTSPEKASSHKNAILHKWKYPKEVFGYYKSAEVHTVKRSIPLKLILAGVFVASVIVLIGYVMHRLNERAHGRGDGMPAAGAVGGQLDGSTPKASGHVSYKDSKDDAMQYLFDRTPRVQGLPQTAPRYDEVTRPTTAPVPVACVANEKRCSCFTQQATPMAVPELLCRDIVSRGYFVDFDDHGGKNQQQGASAGRQEVAVADVSQKVASGAPGPSVVSFDEDGYGVLGKRTGRPAGAK
jgi:zona occludens toxin